MVILARWQDDTKVGQYGLVVRNHDKNCGAGCEKCLGSLAHKNRMVATRIEIQERAVSSQGTDSTSIVSSLHTSVGGTPSTDAVFSMMVTRMVNENVFPKKQFVILETELDVNGKVASKCLSALHLDKSKWYVVKDMIRKRINRRRNNAQLSMRRSFQRKSSSGKCHQG